MRVTRRISIAAVLVAAGMLTVGVSSAGAATVPDGYFISVSPTSQDPGGSVTVTGDGQYYTPPFSGDNCDSVAISVTVTYFTTPSTQKTQTMTLGTSDGNGNISGPATIPADAGPTSVTSHNAQLQASCDNGGDVFQSNAVDVVILGSVPPTTTTTTTTTTTPSAPTSTSTTRPTTISPTTPSTTTAPATSTITRANAAPAATAVSGSPNFTG